MADAVTREASKKGAVLAVATQAVSEVTTQEKKRSTTAKLQLLSSGGLRLITAGGTAPGQTNTGEPAKGQQRFFTRQTPDGQWQLLMSCDSDPGRVYLLQAPTSQPVRASESKAVSKATKTDSSSSKMPMKVFLVNPKESRLISSVASNGRSLLGGQEKTASRAAKVPGKAISLLPSSLHLVKAETSVKTASPGGSSGNVPVSDTKGSYLVSVPTITASTQRTPRRWSAARSPRLVQLEKPITSRRANKVVKPPAAAALLSGALKKCKKFPKIKEEPVIKKEKVFDRNPAGDDSDSADDLPVTFPFKIDSVFSLSSADPAAASLNEENEAQNAEVKVEVKDEPVSEQFCQEELSQEELLDLCGSSFVVLERLSKQNIDEKAQPRLRSRCSDYCRKRTLKYLCMLNLIKCRPSKMRRDERDAGGGQSEEGSSGEGSSGERVMHVEGGAEYAGLAANKANQNASSNFSSKRRAADINSVVAGAVLPTVSTHVGVISDVTHAPTDRQDRKSKNTTVTFANGSDDASDKRDVVQDDFSGVKKSEGFKRASAPAKTPNTFSPRPRQTASATVKNLAKLVRKGSVAMSDQEKKLVFLARKEPKTSSSPLIGHSSPSVAAPSVTCVQLLSAPGMGPTATAVVPAMTSASSGTAPSIPPTSCVFTFVITTSASTVAASRPSLVTSSSTPKPAGLQTLMIPGSFQTVPSAAATVRQPNAISKTVPLLQTPTSLVSFLQGSKIGKAPPAILSASPQPTVVMTAVAPPSSGLQMTPVTTNAVVPTSKAPCFTSTAGVTSMSSALTTATCSVTSLSSPTSSVGLQPIAPKGQSTSQTSSAAILMSVAVDDSLSKTFHAAPSRVTQGLVPDSSVTSKAIPTILAFPKPILASVPQLPSAGELSDFKTILSSSSSPCTTTANVSSIEPFPSSAAKCPPLRTFVTPNVTPGSKRPLVTIPNSSFKSSKSKIKIVFPVNASATSVVTGTSLLKAIPPSAPSVNTLSHPAASPNMMGHSNAGEVPSGPIPSLNTEPVVSGESSSSGSKVKVVTVVFPKAAKASAGSQTVQSQLLNANLPVGLRLVKCGKPENGHQPRPKYSLFSSGSKIASACKPEERPAGQGEGKATAAHEAVMGKPSSTTNCTASGNDAEHEPAAKRRSTEGKGDAERRAKRARLEKRYPLPPGVVIKCEPVTSGYPGDDAPNAAPMKELPPACMADDVRSPQTSGQGATRGEETRLEPPGGNEVEAQLPELETGDEAVARNESETDDFLFDEPPILTPVFPLEPGSSSDTASLVTELSAALHQKPASRLRVRIVSATGKDVAADTHPSSSSPSSSLLSLSSWSAGPSSSSFPAYIPKTTSLVSSSSANDRIRKLKEQLRKQQDELDEIRKRRALEKPFCLEGDS